MKTAGVFALLWASAAAFTSPLLATRAVGGIDKKTVKSTVAKVSAPVKKAATNVKKAVPVNKVTSAVKKAAPVKKVTAAVKKAAPVKKVTAAVKKAPAPVKKAVSAVKKAAPVPKQAGTKAVSSFRSAAKSVAASATKAPPQSQGYPSFSSSAQNFSLGRISGGGNKSIRPVFVHPTVNTAAVPSFDYKDLGKKRLSKIKGDFVYDDGLTELERRQRATIPAFLTGGAKTFKNVDKTAITKDIAISDYPFGLNGDQFQLLFISIFGLFTLVGALSGNIKLD